MTRPSKNCPKYAVETVRLDPSSVFNGCVAYSKFLGSDSGGSKNEGCFELGYILYIHG